MPSISELAKAVREDNLSREKLDEYYTHLASLSALMNVEMGDLTKQEAIFLESCEGTAVMASRKWGVTPQGQRQTELKYGIRAVDKLIGSVKRRLYSFL